MKTLKVTFRFVCLALAMVCGLTSARASVVELLWDDPDNPAGTVIHYGVWIQAPGETEFTQRGSALSAAYELQNAAPGTYSIYVTAVNDGGLHSPPSNTIQFTVPAAPKNLRIKIAIQTSDDMETWTTVAVHYAPAETLEFFRLAFAP